MGVAVRVDRVADRDDLHVRVPVEGACEHAEAVLRRERRSVVAQREVLVLHERERVPAAVPDSELRLRHARSRDGVAQGQDFHNVVGVPVDIRSVHLVHGRVPRRLPLRRRLQILRRANRYQRHYEHHRRRQAHKPKQSSVHLGTFLIPSVLSSVEE